MAPLKAFFPILLASLAACRQCTNLTIPVDISSRQGLFKEVPVETNLDVRAFTTRFNEYQTNLTATLLQGYQTLKGSYEISAQYCHPDSGSNGIIQLLSHGIGFDKTYWDLNYNNFNYSYVNNALENGYSTLAIDRLGIGNSSHGEPFNEIQSQAEIEALNAVTTKLRSGAIDQIGSYKKIIHVGHSFGSVQSYWLSALYPNNTDGLVLTGYSTASQFLAYFAAGANFHSARLNQPLRFGNVSISGLQQLAAKYNVSMDLVPALQQLVEKAGLDLSAPDVWNLVGSTEVGNLINGFNKTAPPLNYPSGYFANSDLTSDQYLFLYPGNYDVGLAVAGEQSKQPVTTGELLTIGSAPKMSTFTGPAFVITGERDVPFCGGNCYGQVANITAPNIPAGVKTAFPSASAFEAYIQPETGHGLTLHYNATAGYQVIQDFLKRNGLAAQ